MTTPVNSRDVLLQAASIRVLDTALTREEKPSYINLYSQIITKQPILNQAADRYGIATEKTTYNNAIAALTAYLATITVPVAWNVLTNSTNIIRATFNTKFSDVLAAEQALELLTTNKYGLTTTIIYAYQRSATVPTLKPGDVTYTFLDAAITTPSTDALANGWTKTIPSGTNPLYVCVASASNTTATDTINNAEWTTPTLYGTVGLSTATVFIYKRSTSSTPPTLPSVDSTYTFNPPSIAGLDNGWTSTIPTSGGGYLYVSTATAFGATATDTIPPGEWAPASALSIDGTGLSLSSTSQSFIYNGLGVAEPSSQTITFTANLQNLTGTPSFTCTKYDSAGSSLGTVTLGGSGNTRTLTNVMFDVAAYAKIVCTLGSYTDTITVVRLTDGSPNLVGYLTNEAHTVPANAAGLVPDFTGTSGTFKVFLGLTEVTASCTFSIVGTPLVTTTAPTAGTGAYSVTAANTWANSSSSTSVTYRATYLGTNIDKVFSISKAIAGTAAAVLYITATSQSFTFNGLDVAAPTSQTITFTSVFQGLQGISSWTCTRYDSAGANLGTVTLGSPTGSTRTLTVAQFDNAHYAIVEYSLSGYSDSITVVRLTDGEPNLVGYLTNEAHTVASNSDGSSPVFTGASGTFKVFLGLIDVTASATFSVVGSPEVTTSAPTAGTGAYSVTGSGTWPTANTVTTVTYRATYNSMTLDKVFSLAKAKAGLSAPLLFLSCTSQSFTYDGIGAANPSSQTISFTANLQNVTGTATFVATKYNISGTSLGTITMGGSGNTRTITNTQFDVAAYVIVSATLGALTDTVTAVRLTDGSPSLTGYLTNESHTVPASSSGVPSSFSGASGTFKVFLGLIDVTASATFSVVGSPEVTTSAPTAGTGAYSVTAAGTWASGSNTTFVTYRATYNSVTIDKVFSLTKSLAGATGSPGSPGGQGDPGVAGASIRIAYIASSVTSAAGSYTPDSGSTTVPTPSNASPNNWGLTGTWRTTPMSLSAGQFMYQSDGIYNPATGQTTWNTPYWSTLKVGSLDAITVNTGALTVSTSISAGSAAISGTTMTGSGFKMYSSGNFVIGTSSGNINYNGSQITFNGPVVSGGSFSSPAITSGSLSSVSISSSTITAGTFYSSASNPKLSINESSNNKILIYNSSGTVVTDIGGSGGTIYVSGIAGSQPGVYSSINSAAASIAGSNSGSGAGGQFSGSAGNRGIYVDGILDTVSKSGDDGIARMNSVVPLATASWTLGKSTLRWNGIFSTVAVDVSSDIRTKTNVQDSDFGLGFILKLRPVKYTLKLSQNKVIPDDDFMGPYPQFGGQPTKIEQVIGSRYHYGLISQEVKEVLGDNDAAFWCLADKDDPDSQQSLRYEELISPMIKAIQEMYTELQQVKEELNILKQSQ